MDILYLAAMTFRDHHRLVNTHDGISWKIERLGSTTWNHTPPEKLELWDPKLNSVL